MKKIIEINLEGKLCVTDYQQIYATDEDTI